MKLSEFFRSRHLLSVRVPISPIKALVAMRDHISSILLVASFGLVAFAFTL